MIIVETPAMGYYLRQPIQDSASQAVLESNNFEVPGIFRNPGLAASYARGKADVVAGRLHSFTDVEEAIRWLNRR